MKQPMEPPERIRLGRGTLGTERHVCAFFRSPEEEYETLLPFIKEGFERGETSFWRTRSTSLRLSFSPDFGRKTPSKCASGSSRRPAGFSVASWAWTHAEALVSRVPLADLARSCNRFLCTRDLGSKYATLVIASLRSRGPFDLCHRRRHGSS